MNNKINLILASALLLSLNAFALTPPSVGVLTKVIQQVEYKAFETEDWGDADLGNVVNNGDEVRTGERSLALIKFLDNSLLRIRENTVVTLYGTKEESVLNKNTFIQEGKVGFEVNKQEDEEFKFTTPTAVASIRGTKGFFEVPVDGPFRVYIKEGLLELESLIGAKGKGSVGAGQIGVVTTEGQVSVEQASENVEDEYEGLTKEETKSIRIKLENGEEYIIEYLE